MTATTIPDPSTPFGKRIEKSIPYRISLLSSALFKGSSRYFANRINLGLPEVRVLQIVALDAPLSASEVAQRSAMDKGQVSRAITALIGRGYIKRASKPGGGRRIMLSLTRQGRTVANKALEIGDRRQERIQSWLKPAERDQLIEMLDRLLVHTEQLNAEEAEEIQALRRVA